MTNYNDGNWHGWNGGECPMHGRCDVQIVWQFKDGTIRDGQSTGPAYDWNWEGNEHGDIVAFRVIKEHQEPREFWVHPWTLEAATECVEHYIHVREVIEDDA